MLPVRGTSLLSIALAIAVSAVLASGVTEKKAEVKVLEAARRTAAEVKVITSAARSFFVEHGSWPPSLEELRSEGYFAPGWSGLSPFGTGYQLVPEGRGLLVRVNLPVRAAEAAAAALPEGRSVGGLLEVFVPPPGTEAGTDEALARLGSDQDRRMRADLLLGGFRARDFADPVSPRDAVTLGYARRTYLGSGGGTMTGPLETPGLQARRFSEGAFHEDPSGTGYVNLWDAWDVYVRAAGRWLSEILSTAPPGQWTLVLANSQSPPTACCPLGYVPVSTEASQSEWDCWFFFSGGRWCLRCGQGSSHPRSVGLLCAR